MIQLGYGAERDEDGNVRTFRIFGLPKDSERNVYSRHTGSVRTELIEAKTRRSAVKQLLRDEDLR